MNEQNYIYKVLDIKQETIQTPHKVKAALNTQSVAEIIEEVLGIKESTREHFIMLGLNTQLEVNVAYVVHIGTLNASIVHPRESFQVAIMHNCTHVIFAHNHPGKSLEPSDADIYMSKKLKISGEILGIDMLDSLIVTEHGVTSLEEEGYLSEIDIEDVISLINSN